MTRMPALGQLLPIANDSYRVINLVSLARVDWLQLAESCHSNNVELQVETVYVNG